MVITGIVQNPGSDEDEIILSMQDAVAHGILDLQNGLYHNPTTKESLSFVEAMNCGYIKVSSRHQINTHSSGMVIVWKNNQSLSTYVFITSICQENTTPALICTLGFVFLFISKHMDNTA